MRLFKADMFHISKDKLIRSLLLLTFLLPLATCIVTRNMGGEKMSVETLVFQGLGTDILCVIIGIALSSFIGKDYQNNTIRNKICYGEDKTKVAGVFFIETLLVAVSFVLASTAGSLLFGSFFCEHSFTSDFFPKILCQTMIIVAFAVCITAVVISAKSVKAGFIFTILVSVLLGAVSYMFPINAANNAVMAVLSRVLYMVVSNMVLKGSSGVYQVAGYTFDHVYLNAVTVACVYMVIAVSICFMIVRKHEYK